MASGEESIDLTGRAADPALLSTPERLPAIADSAPRQLTRAPSVARSAAAGSLIAAGVTLTALSVVAGLALVAWGVLGGAPGGAGVAIALGTILIATHIGWAHVATALADGITSRAAAAAQTGRRDALARLEPYVQEEVAAEPGEDGSVELVTLRHRPEPSGERHFTFVREVIARETHPPETPAAVIAERAESLRRAAAERTAAAREAYASALAERRAQLGAHDAEQLDRAAAHATARAVSERLNALLREPPADEEIPRR